MECYHLACELEMVARTQNVLAPLATEQKIMSKRQDPAAAETARTTDSPAVAPATACYANLGAEILALLRSKADAPWEYYNPHFLLAITEQIEAYYKVEDDVVDDWVQEMFSA